MVIGLGVVTLWGSVVAGLVFAWAGVAKIVSLRRFGGVLRNAFGLPRAVARIVAIALPLAELAIGALLLLRIETRAAATSGAALLLIFICALARLATSAETHVSCGCFGEGEPQRIATLLLRNAVLLMICLIAGWSGVPAVAPSLASMAALLTLFAAVLLGSAMLGGLARLRAMLRKEEV